MRETGIGTMYVYLLKVHVRESCLNGILFLWQPSKPYYQFLVFFISLRCIMRYEATEITCSFPFLVIIKSMKTRNNLIYHGLLIR